MTPFVGLRYQAKVRQQWRLFCLALMFFTRLPVPKNLPYSEQKMNQANRYFSLVGLVVGAIVAGSFALAQGMFSVEVSVLLAMTVSLLVSGAFHEDGLADMADGIGGGFTVEKRLSIMKDSRLGTYGSVTLLLTLMLKFQLIVDLTQYSMFALVVIFSYGMSRALAASLILNTPYVTDVDVSKSKPLASKQTTEDLQCLFAVVLVPFAFFFSAFTQVSWLVLKLALVLFIFRWCYRRWLIARIGGFNGDCLGGAQQLSELLVYLVVLQHLSAGGTG